MNKFFKPVLSGIVGVALFSWAPQTHAIPLGEGATVFGAGEPDPIGGSVLAMLTVPFVGGSAPNAFAGSITSTVIEGAAANPYGGLTFTYLFSINAGSADDIGRLTVEGFSGFSIDASYQVPLVAGAIAPTIIDRTGMLLNGGDVVGFTFLGAPVGAGQVGPGAVTALLVLQTSATAYKTAQGNLIDGGVTQVSILAPAVPDGGATVLLLGCALLGIEGLRRKLAMARQI